jgi:cell division protein FtsI/penicillin-binding protein 2
MTTELDELRAARPQVAPPSDEVRRAGLARLTAAIEDEPAELYGGRRRPRTRRPRRRLNLGALVTVAGVLVTLAIVVGAVALLGHRAPRHDSAALAAHPGRILAADGSPLNAKGPLTSVLGSSGLRTQYRSTLRSGADLRTSLDGPLQRVADGALRTTLTLNHGATQASLVAMDPRSGAIEAIGSAGASSAHVDGAVQTASPPGGAFDPITALAALSSGRWTPSRRFDDTGTFCIGAGPSKQCRRNAGSAAYGPLDLSSDLMVQGDDFMSHLGALMNVSADGHPLGGRLQSMARSLGLGHRPNVDLPGAAAGLVPTPRWVSSHTADHLPWSVGDELSLAVGQGDVTVTPLQLAVAYADLETGITPVQPRLGAAVVRRDGTTRPVGANPILARVPAAQAAFPAVRAGLRRETSSPGGTSFDVFRALDEPVAGQLGTAQVTNRTDDGWFAGWVAATASHGPLVVVVRVIGGGFGAASAAPVGHPGPWRPGTSIGGE